jgi:hypothetical protein
LVYDDGRNPKRLTSEQRDRGVAGGELQRRVACGATIPGMIDTDLGQAGVIPEPYLQCNGDALQRWGG